MNTICAIATAPGGAIGIIRVSGDEAIIITDQIFQGRQSLLEVKPYSLQYGKIIDTAGEVLDEVLVSVFRAPHSYTGENSCEISCHGSSYILETILNLLIQKGCQMAAPGEFTQRAFTNGKMDLSQAEAVADLIATTNKATHRMAMSQLRGSFSQELETLRNQLLQITSLLELELDFSEEDVEFADRTKLINLTQLIQQHVATLRDSFQTGNAIKRGVPVAIIGAPNVGKSTLLNRLLGEERAIVSNIQGTTRDTIEDCVQIGGITFRFIDTAGIRKTNDTIEKMGIERSLQAAQSAQIILLLSEKDTEFPNIQLPEDKTVLQVVTKCDYTLPSNSFLYHRMPTGNLFHISASTGDGIDLLRQALVKLSAVPEVTENNVIVSNVRHYTALSAAYDDLQRVLDGLTAQAPSDLVSEDLRQCLHHLAEITGGSITSDEVLGNIFKNFCIGK